MNCFHPKYEIYITKGNYCVFDFQAVFHFPGAHFSGNYEETQWQRQTQTPESFNVSVPYGYKRVGYIHSICALSSTRHCKKKKKKNIFCY